MAGACAPALQAESSVDETLFEATEEVQTVEKPVLSGIILPHHEMASQLIQEAWAVALESEPDLIVLIGPDHPGLADHPLIWTEGTCVPLQLLLSPLAEEWINAGIGGEAMVADHSIEIPLKYLPEEAREIPVLALTVPRGMDGEHIDRLVSEIQALSGSCLLVGSVDFSHGLVSETSQIRDEESISWIQARDYSAIQNAGNEYFDTPEVLEILLRCCTGQVDQIKRSDSTAFGWSQSLPGTSYQVIEIQQ